MERREIADVFARMAVLLQLKGENNFKIRAFQNAARVLQGFSGSDEEFMAQLNYGLLKGFGPQMTEHVLTLRKTGELPYFYELQAEVPEGLLELLEIPGLGVQKVRQLYDALGISTPSQLKRACKKNEVAAIRGFGEKTQAQLLQALELWQSFQGQLRRGAAERLSADLLAFLLDSSPDSRLAVTGSVRRKCEIARNVNLLAATSEPAKITQALAQYETVEKIAGCEATQCTVILQTGTVVALQAVEENDWVAALHHHTGSREHLVQLAQFATQQGRRLSERGWLEPPPGQFWEDEEQIYADLGLVLVPPELREGCGELEAAARLFQRGQGFTRLVTQADIKGILHAHSTYSDGVQSLEDLAGAVLAEGYQYLGISDHSRSAAYAGGLSIESVKRQQEEIDRLNEKLAPFRIFKGIESEIMPDGSLDYTNSVMDSFDFVIVSVHSVLHMGRERMTQRICRALANPYTTILGHPSGRLLLRRNPYELDMEQVLNTAAEHGVAIEINANPSRLDLDWREHQRAKELGIPLAICPDAHAAAELGYVRYGVDAARKGRLEAADILTCLSADELAWYFEQKRQQRQQG